MWSFFVALITWKSFQAFQKNSTATAAVTGMGGKSRYGIIRDDRGHLLVKWGHDGTSRDGSWQLPPDTPVTFIWQIHWNVLGKSHLLQRPPVAKWYNLVHNFRSWSWVLIQRLVSKHQSTAEILSHPDGWLHRQFHLAVTDKRLWKAKIPLILLVRVIQRSSLTNMRKIGQNLRPVETS